MREIAMAQAESTLRADSAPRRVSPARLVLLVLGITLVVLFTLRVGAGEVARQLGRAGPKALFLLVPYAVGTAIGAFPWRSLLPRGLRPPIGGTVLGRLVASSANSLLPFFGLAGEPTRLLWLAPAARPYGFAAIVVDRLLYNLSNGALLVVGALFLGLSSLPASLALAALISGILTLAVTFVGFAGATRARLGERLHALVERLMRKSYAAAGFGSEVDAVLVRLVRGPREPLVGGAVVHVLGRATLALEVPIGLWILGARPDATAALALVLAPLALSLFFSSVPSQIGIQEGTQTLLATALHLSPALVLSLVLLQRGRQLVFAALLPLVMALARPVPTRVV
jgi:hypothetical protein